MIEFDDVSFTYAGAEKAALDRVSLVIPTGDLVGIVGPSGSGKTTLGYAMSGAIPHCLRGDFYGSVRVDGTDTFECSLTDVARTVGMVMQDIDTQMVSTVVEDEMLFGLENFGAAHEDIEPRLAEALALLDIADLRSREIASLSGGQKQKVALAAMLALRPRVLILDQPTGALDPAASRRAFEAFRMLNAQGITIVVIEQDLGLLATYAEHLILMDAGTICLQGKTREVLTDTDLFRRLGVSIPRMVELTEALREEGMTTEAPCADVDEAERLVRRILA